MSSLYMDVTPHRDGFGPLLALLALLAAMSLSFLVFHNRQAAPESGSAVISLSSIRQLHSAEVLSRTGKVVRLRLSLRKEPYVVIALRKRIHRRKLHLHIGELQKIRQIRIYPKLVGKPYSHKNVILLPVGRAGGTRHHFNAVLPDGEYENLRIDFKSGDHFGVVEIKGISLLPVESADQLFWVYLLVFFLAALVLLPGMLLFPLFHGKTTERGVCLSVFTGYSVLFYVFVYLAWRLVLKWWPVAADPAALVVVFTGLPLMCWLNRRRDVGISYYFGKLRYELFLYLAVLLVCCFILVQHHRRACSVENVSRLSGP